MRLNISLAILLGVVSVHALPSPGLFSSLGSVLSGSKSIGLGKDGVSLKNTKTKSSSDVQETQDSTTTYDNEQGDGYSKESGSQTNSYSKDAKSYNEESTDELNLLGGGGLLSYSQETSKTTKESSVDAEDSYSYTDEQYAKGDTSAASYSESERSKYEANEDTYSETSKKSYGLGLGGLTAKKSKDSTHESSSVKKESGSDLTETEYSKNGEEGSTNEYTQSSSNYANEDTKNSINKESTRETKSYDAKDLTGGSARSKRAVDYQVPYLPSPGNNYEYEYVSNGFQYGLPNEVSSQNSASNQASSRNANYSSNESAESVENRETVIEDLRSEENVSNESGSIDDAEIGNSNSGEFSQVSYLPAFVYY